MKKIAIYLLIMVMMFSLAGCAGSNTEGDTENNSTDNAVEYDFTAAELAAYIKDNVEFKDSMDVIDNSVLFDVYNIDSSKVSDACAYFSTGATAEEIVVMTADSSDLENNKAEISDAYNNRILSQIDGFTNYVPEELDKLSDPLILEVGNTVVMVVCDDKEKAKEVVLGYLN